MRTDVIVPSAVVSLSTRHCVWRNCAGVIAVVSSDSSVKPVPGVVVESAVLAIAR